VPAAAADGDGLAAVALGRADGVPVGAPDGGAAEAVGSAGDVGGSVGWPSGVAVGTEITCTPGLIPASLTTMFAPNQASPTAMAVPASQAARPVRARVMSAIMPQAGR